MIQEGQVMAVSIPGHFKNGVVVPEAPLPEGAQVEIRLTQEPMQASAKQKNELAAPEDLVPAARLSPGELRRLPREERQTFLAAAAEMAEQDYRTDKDLTGFEAFSDEELDHDESDLA
jgi:hypothetical protein